MNIQNGSGQHVRAGMQQGVGNWRVELTRDQRQELIAKIYHELIRVTGERPGTAVWMKASLYELKLFQESAERKEYINKIARRLYLLKLRPNAATGQMNPAIAHQNPQQNISALGVGMAMHTPQHQMAFGMQTYVQSQDMAANALASNPVDAMKVNSQGVGINANAAQLVQQKRAMQRAQQLAQQQDSSSPLHHKSPHSNSQMNTSQYGIMSQTGNNSEQLKLYMDKLMMLKTKYWEHVMIVYRAFHKYVAHLGAQDDSDQKKKLKYLLAYVNHVVTFLSEDPTQKEKLDIAELEKVERYIQRIVIPYLAKLSAEKTKNGGLPTGGNGGIPTPVGDSLFSPQNSTDPMASLNHSQQISSSMTPGQIGGISSYPSYSSSGADLNFGQGNDLNFGTPTNAMNYMSSGYNMASSNSISLGTSAGSMNPGSSYASSNNTMGMSGSMTQSSTQQNVSSVATSQQQQQSSTTVQSTVTTTSEQSDRNGNSNSGSNTPAQQLMTLVETL